MTIKYIALDPIDGAPVAMDNTVEGVKTQLAELPQTGFANDLSVPIYRCAMKGNKVISSTKVDEAH